MFKHLEDKTIAEGILKIDIGVAVNGFIADTAISVDLTDDKRFENMINLNKEILNRARKNVKSGIGDIYESKPGGIYIIKNSGNARDRDAKNILKFVKEKFGGFTPPLAINQSCGLSYRDFPFSIRMTAFKQSFLVSHFSYRTTFSHRRLAIQYPQEFQ